MTKPWVRTEVFNNREQKLLIQPITEFDGIEIYIQEVENDESSGAFYINKEELPVLIEKLQEMMNYVNKNN